MVTRVDTKCPQCGAIVARSEVQAHYTTCARRPENPAASWWACPWCERCEVIGLPQAIHNAVFYHVCPVSPHETRIEYRKPRTPEPLGARPLPIPQLGHWWAGCKCGQGAYAATPAEAHRWERDHLTAVLEAVDNRGATP